MNRHTDVRVLIVMLMLSCLGANAIHAASTQPASSSATDIHVFASADESTQLIEILPGGSILAPMAEMIGAGGVKWFMVRTPTGNIGWIKSDSHPTVKGINEHFRGIAKEPVSIGPGDPSAATRTTAPNGAMTIPMIYFGRLLVVPVTLTHGTSSATGYFFVDTGASQTVISKRIARDLRLMAVDTGISFGIGGTVSNDIAMVDSIQVGRAGISKTPVSIHDFSPDPRLEGLLGLDFLGRFQMSVDVGKRVMTLTPR